MVKQIKNLMAAAGSGIVGGLLLSVLFSSIHSRTNYYPSTPIFMNRFETQVGAMIVSIIIWGLFGIMSYLSSLIFEKIEGSLMKLTILNFLATYLTITPLVYLAGWFPFKIEFLFSYTLFYVIIYCIIWCVIYFQIKRELSEMNDSLKNR